MSSNVSGLKPRLDGSSLLCECPRCGGPMSVRLWLMEAECWQCHARIELSPNDVSRLEQLLTRQPTIAPTKTSTTALAPREPVCVVTEILNSPVPEQPKKPRPFSEVVSSRPNRVSHTGVRQQGVQAPPIQSSRSVSMRKGSNLDFSGLLERAPAWLVSLVVHLLVFLLLVLLDGRAPKDPQIVLSVAFSPERKEGDIAAIVPADIDRYDFPIPMDMNLESPEVQATLMEAMELASELSEESYDRGFQPEDLGTIRQTLSQPFAIESGLASRDVRFRREILEKGGGTLLTEAAVARALDWFAKHQHSDGSWRLNDRAFGDGRGYLDTNSGATALALLPFLGAGQTHRSGKFQDHVRRGLQYLLDRQTVDGDLRGGTDGEAGMYVQGQATIVLCESLAMTRDPSLRDPAKRAVEFILNAQHSGGGWRYYPDMAGDTSVLGWQVMALQSAKMAGLSVPEKSLRQASRFLDSVSSAKGSLFAYQAGYPATANMTAEGLLCRCYLDGKSERPNIDRGLDILLAEALPNNNKVDFYLLYYATQAFHHRGGERWQRWNEHASRTLVGLQRTSGPHAGSWNVQGYLAEAGGRLYVTALATCTLEVYYRHLPIFAPLTLKD